MISRTIALIFFKPTFLFLEGHCEKEPKKFTQKKKNRSRCGFHPV